MKVKLKDGYEVTVDENALNDWRFLKLLRKVDKGDSGLIVDVAEMLLGGEKEVDKLAKHVEKNGTQSSEDVINAISEIITSVGELKNS